MIEFAKLYRKTKTTWSSFDFGAEATNLLIRVIQSRAAVPFLCFLQKSIEVDKRPAIFTAATRSKLAMTGPEIIDIQTCSGLPPKPSSFILLLDILN